MSPPILIVMYHYVRDLAASSYPRIKGLEADAFRGQLEYLAREHTFITPSHFLAALDGTSTDVPGNAVLLTFDDGYKDHHDVAMPIMQEFGASGIFFVPSRCIERRHVLDVNKIHFLLACSQEPEAIAAALDLAVTKARSDWPELMSISEYRAKYAVANRFDPPVVIYIKRMLQHGLPLGLRARLLNELFTRWVTADESAFADELYLSESDLRHMHAAGMMIGSHGSQHLWMNTCEKTTQAQEIDESLSLLDRIGVSRESWTFCYPYGGYNDDTLTLLQERSCRAAVTTRVDIAQPGLDSHLLLPRLDTNDLPKTDKAAPNDWSRRQQSIASGSIQP